jgi:SPP1 family holin
MTGQEFTIKKIIFIERNEENTMTDLKVKVETIVRTIVLFITMINMLLAVLGKEAIPVKEDQVSLVVSQVYLVASTFAAIGSAIWAWWKNNSFTKPAIKADNYLETLK